MFFDEQSGFKIFVLFSRVINEYTLSDVRFPARSFLTLRVINPINFEMLSFVNNVEKIKNVCRVKKKCVLF